MYVVEFVCLFSWLTHAVFSQELEIGLHHSANRDIMVYGVKHLIQATGR